MRFSAGYQLPYDDAFSFMDAVAKYKDHIAEVYFPWQDFPTGRAVINERDGRIDWSTQETLEADLKTLKRMGIKLDILFNANCYGSDSISNRLSNKIISILEYLGEIIGGVDIATTTSPAIAHVINSSFPEIEVRASVNMQIGTIKGMQYLADLFDSFHIQREFNRNLEYISRLKEWADSNGKKLIMLANSGCLIHCSGQIFHDNLVAHDLQIASTDNIKEWNPHLCWRFLKKRENWGSVLQNTWIRPEDIHYYGRLFDIVKLATRMHSNPAMVIGSYAKGRYHGNLLDLFEPGLGPALNPWIVDNDNFPVDWFERTSSCHRQCVNCDYCKTVFDMVLRKK